MAHPSKITLAITDSVKIDNYQYIKPTVSVDVTLNPGDNVKDTVDKAKANISKIMDQWKEELKDRS